MASGLPAVVMNAGGPPEQVRHGIDGFIAEDDDSFAKYTSLLAQDASLRRAMSARAQESAQKVSWGVVCEDLIDYFEDVKRS